MSERDEVHRAVSLIKRMLREPRLLHEFRTDPQGVLDREGIESGTFTELQTLEPRESRSSLAGALAAAAVEGIAVLDILEQAPPPGPAPVAHVDVSGPPVEHHDARHDVRAIRTLTDEAEEEQDGSHAAAGRMLSHARRELDEGEMTASRSSCLARYRGGSAAGPWGVYFVLCVAKKAGHPLGEQARRRREVSHVWRWAERHDAAMPGSHRPDPGDLILLSEFSHVGIVESLLDDGGVQTIEGRHHDRLERVVRRPEEAWGYVRMGERR